MFVALLGSLCFVAPAHAQNFEIKDLAIPAEVTREQAHALHIQLGQDIAAAETELSTLAQRSIQTQKSLAKSRGAALQEADMKEASASLKQQREALRAIINGSAEVVALLKKREGMDAQLTEVSASRHSLMQTMQREGRSDALRQSMLEASGRATKLQRDRSRLNLEIEAEHDRIRASNADAKAHHAAIVEAEHLLDAQVREVPEVNALEAERKTILTQTRDLTRRISELNGRVSSLDCCKQTNLNGR
ncbi:MAG: hypothetical protein OSB41_02930 [Kiritimatiellae bacterium]|nr:hypothetical protein [Kiritimatiellia bacterium]